MASYDSTPPFPSPTGKSFQNIIDDLEQYIVLNTEGKVTAPIVQNIFKNILYTIPLSGTTNFNISSVSNNEILKYESGKWTNSSDFYTISEANSKFVYTSGDTINGNLTVNGNLDVIGTIDLTGSTTFDDIDTNTLNLASGETIWSIQNFTGITNSSKTILTEQAISNLLSAQNELGELTNVDLNSVQIGDSLYYSGGSWKNIPVYNTGQTYTRSEIEFLASVSGLTDSIIINPTSGYTQSGWGYPYENYKANDALMYKDGYWKNILTWSADDIINITQDLRNLEDITDDVINNIQSDNFFVNRRGITDYPNSDSIGDLFLVNDGDSGMTWQSKIIWASNIKTTNILLDELNSYWKLDNNLYDSEGKKDLITGSTNWFVSGKINQASSGGTLYGNYTNGVVSSYSVSFWLSSGVTNPVFYILSGDTMYNELYFDGSTLKFDYNETGTTLKTIDTSTIPATGFTHYVVSYDKTTTILNIYENNSNIYSSNLIDMEVVSYKDYSIIFNSGNTIDEIGFWLRDLQNEEVILLYNSNNGYSYENFKLNDISSNYLTNAKIEFSGSTGGAGDMVFSLNLDGTTEKEIVRYTENESLLIGNKNSLNGDYVSIVGGRNNEIDNSDYSFIGGGNNNNITGSTRSFIGGGSNNIISNITQYSFIGGGFTNKIIDDSFISVISGGWDNEINNSDVGFIGGGKNNYITYSEYSFIGGGETNSIESNAYYSFIGGGYDNYIWKSPYCFIGGGQQNNIKRPLIGLNWNSFIGAGRLNKSYSNYSFIGAGYKNEINDYSNYSFIGGGYNNEIDNSTYAAITSGEGLQLTGNSHATAVGKFNYSGRTSGDDVLFVVGNGTSNTSRSDAMVVTSGDSSIYVNNKLHVNNDVEISGNIDVPNVSKLIKNEEIYNDGDYKVYIVKTEYNNGLIIINIQITALTAPSTKTLSGVIDLEDRPSDNINNVFGGDITNGLNSFFINVTNGDIDITINNTQSVNNTITWFIT